uniref:Siderophore-mediated iron transport protein n=1 Tax=uncultured bacterium contig00052 TaxID=1181536 RepID=A0A806JYT0_9BACT|nr:siderophore-mediated iron transport protein [uncultured bacterium contig00052]
MMHDFYNEKNGLFLIIASSFTFHSVIIIALALVVWFGPKKEPPPQIPFFELINVAPPPPAPQAAKPEPLPEPVPEPIPEPLPEIKPDIKPDIKPEPKPEPKKPDPKPIVEKTQETPPKEEPAPPSMDMPMDLPKDIKKPDMDMPALRTLGNVAMDPQMQAYLNQLLRLIYQNFNPPSGTEITKGTKSSVAFKIERNGEISEVVLRSSSGNGVWDRLAVRAVQITKPPPLPPSYTAENLPLIFDFREK